MSINKNSAIICIIVSTLLALTQPAWSKQVIPGPFLKAKQCSNELMQQLLKINRVPGMGVAVAVKNKIVWSEGFGYADVEKKVPVTSRTRFPLASVSKLLTVTAAAKLYEMGRLDLDAPVRKYVPVFPDKGAPITARHLAGHLSGIGHYTTPWSQRGQKHFNSVIEALKLFAHRPLLSPPGDAYIYSSYGYTLLSSVIEAAAKTEFLLYLEKNIFKPLGMTNTGPDYITVKAPEKAVRHRRFGNGVIPVPFHDQSYIWAGGGMIGTADDLMRLAWAWLGNKFLKPETIKMMWMPQKTNNGNATGRYYYEVGFGWRIGEDWKGRKIVHHAGAGAGARSVLVIYPEQGLSIAVLSNLTWVSSIERTASTLAEPFLNTLEKQTSKPLKGIEGTYRFSGKFRGKPASGDLVIQSSNGGYQGSISLPDAFSQWLDSFNTDTPNRLFLSQIAIDNSRIVFAMVTPIGIMEMPVTFKDREISAFIPLGRGQTWTFTIKKQ